MIYCGFLRKRRRNLIQENRFSIKNVLDLKSLNYLETGIIMAVLLIKSSRNDRDLFFLVSSGTMAWLKDVFVKTYRE